MKNNRKVVIIGAGFVGASIAYALTLKNSTDEIVLIDKNNNSAKGEALDINHGVSLMGSSYVHCGNYEECKDSQIIILTAGKHRDNGQTRMDLAKENIEITKNIISEIKKYYNGALILVISNPVDIITTLVTEMMGLPDGMVFGSGTLLDTSRLTCKVAEYMNLRPTEINCFVVGQHGECSFPVWSKSTVKGLSIDEYCKSNNLLWNDTIKGHINNSVRIMGADIISAKGKTQYGIATCVCLLVDLILNNKSTIVCVSSLLKGEYGIKDISLSVPSIVDKNGVHKIFNQNWLDSEFSSLREIGISLSEEYKNLINFH